MTVDFERVNRACERAFAQTTFAYTPPGGGAVEGIKGDSRVEPVMIEDEGQSRVKTRTMTLGVRLAQAVLIESETVFEIDGTVTIGGADFRVADVDDNGEGHVWLRLLTGE